MTQQNIFAFTEAVNLGQYVAYVSINKQEAGHNTLTVRSRSGSQGEITLTDLQLAELAELAASIQAHLRA